MIRFTNLNSEMSLKSNNFHSWDFTWPHCKTQFCYTSLKGAFLCWHLSTHFCCWNMSLFLWWTFELKLRSFELTIFSYWFLILIYVMIRLNIRMVEITLIQGCFYLYVCQCYINWQFSIFVEYMHKMLGAKAWFSQVFFQNALFRRT